MVGIRHLWKFICVDWNEMQCIWMDRTQTYVQCYRDSFCILGYFSRFHSFKVFTLSELMPWKPVALKGYYCRATNMQIWIAFKLQIHCWSTKSQYDDMVHERWNWGKLHRLLYMISRASFKWFIPQTIFPINFQSKQFLFFLARLSAKSNGICRNNSISSLYIFFAVRKNVHSFALHPHWVNWAD